MRIRYRLMLAAVVALTASLLVAGLCTLAVPRSVEASAAGASAVEAGA